MKHRRLLAPLVLLVVALCAGCNTPAEPAPYTGGGSGGGAGFAGGGSGGTPQVGNGGDSVVDAGHGGSGATDACNGRGDAYVSGMERSGSLGWTVRLVEADPAPPAAGDNRWVVELEDTDGRLVEGATLGVEPLMVDHGHGTPIAAQVVDLGGGSYMLERVNLLMAGYWTVAITIRADGQSDKVTFGFCVG